MRLLCGTLLRASSITSMNIVWQIPPIKVKLLRMMNGRCVVRGPHAGDGTLTCVILYLECNRKIFKLMLHWDHVH